LPPEYLRAGAIVLTLLSAALLALAAREWLVRASDADAVVSRRNGLWGGVVLFLVSIGLVGGALALAAVMRWNRDRVMWVGVGGFLGLMTILRPWWFWENYRARWLRKIIGDGATAVIYMALAAAMVWIGFNTDWVFGRR
jgi:hypothetical protein